MLYDTNFLDFIHVDAGRAIQNRKLWSIYLNHTVVYPHCIQGRKTVLNGRNAHVATRQNRATLRVNHVFGNGLNDGLSFQVNPLNFISSIFRSRVKGNCQIQPRVQSFATQGKTTF